MDVLEQSGDRSPVSLQTPSTRGSRKIRGLAESRSEDPDRSPPASVLSPELSDFEQRLQAIRQQTEQAREELRQAEQTLEEVRRQCQDFQAIHLPTHQMVEELHTVRQGLDQTRQELAIARSESETLGHQAQEAAQDFEQAAHFLSTACSQAQAARQQLQEAEQTIRATNEQSEQARERYEQARQWFQEAEEAAQAARRLVQEMKQEREQVRLEVEAAREPVQRSASPPESEAAGEETPPEVSDSGGTVMPALVPAEEARERLIRYLNDAWAVEKTLVEMLQTMAEEVADPELRSLLQEHQSVTRQQKHNLEARLHSLGKTPSGGKGFFDQMLARVWDAMSPPRDELDRTLHDLMKGLGTEHFEIAMYQALEALALAVGDEETTRLAREHLRQEQAVAERLRHFLAPIVLCLASRPESAERPQ